MPATRLEVVNTWEGVRALMPEWQCLYEQCPMATPFQSPYWLTALWRHFPQGELCVWTARREATLIGILPLLQENGLVSFMGASVTDYKDGLIKPGHSEEVMADIESFLAGIDFHFDCIPSNSQLLQLREGWTECGTGPVVQLP